MTNDESARVADKRIGKMLLGREKVMFRWARVKGSEVTEERRIWEVLCLVGRESRGLREE